MLDDVPMTYEEEVEAAIENWIENDRRFVRWSWVILAGMLAVRLAWWAGTGV